MDDAVYRESYPTLWRLMRSEPALQSRVQLELMHLIQTVRAEEVRLCAQIAAERERYCEHELGRSHAAMGIVQGALIAAQGLKQCLESRTTEHLNRASELRETLQGQ